MSAWDKPKCSWCHGKDGVLNEVRVSTLPNAFVSAEREATVYVHPEHEANFRRFNDYRHRFARPALITILSSCLLMLLLGFWHPAFSSALLVVLGVLLLLFPFATSTTYEVMSVRASIYLIRAAGAGFMLFGAWFVWLELL